MTVTTMIFIKQFKSVYSKNISLYRITFEISLSPHKISLTNKQVHFHLLVPFHVSLETDFVKIKKNELNDWIIEFIHGVHFWLILLVKVIRLPCKCLENPTYVSIIRLVLYFVEVRVTINSTFSTRRRFC